jgi:RNA polymerase sigma-70 factor (ECF subfamily)
VTIVDHDEQTLINSAQVRDTDAFATLVMMHGSLVYNLALRTLGDAQEAEDVAQETFVRAWQGLPRFRAQSRLSTWLYRITTNLCYNRLPQIKRDLAALDPDTEIDLPDERPHVEAVLLSSELVEQVHTAVDQIPESYRLLITLRHMQGLSYAEIAAVADLPLGSVKTGIFRARQQLKKILERELSSKNG